MAAEILAARFGQGGLFLGLPTMATANPMFERVITWLETMEGTQNSVNLAHSKADLYEGFDKIVRASRVAALSGDDPTAEAIRVASWLRGHKRRLLSNIVVGTIDQFLLGGLKAKHVVLRHIALVGKVVMIDEVHAADAYMREYALAMLRWMGRYRVPVVLMSATLPPDQRRAYFSAYASGRGVAAPGLDSRPGYPRVTAFDGKEVQEEFPTPTPDVSIQLETAPDDEAALADLLEVALADGGCVGIVRNTVGRAQETHRFLREIYGDDVVLLHSRFITPHRLAREATLAGELGRTGTRPRRRIVVGTQVLEQSLDLDFDLLITDIAPIDLVLQRVGRLHRHRRAGRPAGVRLPRVILTGADWSAVPPQFDRSVTAVYGEARLLRAAAVLRPAIQARSFAVPSDIPALVEQGYDALLAPPPGWEEAWGQAERRDRDRTNDARQRAQVFCVEEPDDAFDMSDWMRGMAADPESSRLLGPDSSAQTIGRAQVRDGEDSIEVIVVQRDRDGVLQLPDGDGGGRSIPEGMLPLDDSRLARVMAAHTLSLPLAMCVGAELDATIRALEGQRLPFDQWQSSPWLAGQLALLLDAAGEAEINGFRCSYSRDNGLVVEKRKENR